MGTTDDAELKPVPSKSEKPERVSKSVGVPIKVVSGLLLLWGSGYVAHEWTTPSMRSGIIKCWVVDGRAA